MRRINKGSDFALFWLQYLGEQSRTRLQISDDHGKNPPKDFRQDNRSGPPGAASEFCEGQGATRLTMQWQVQSTGLGITYIQFEFLSPVHFFNLFCGILETVV